MQKGGDERKYLLPLETPRRPVAVKLSAVSLRHRPRTLLWVCGALSDSNERAPSEYRRDRHRCLQGHSQTGDPEEECFIVQDTPLFPAWGLSPVQNPPIRSCKGPWWPSTSSPSCPLDRAQQGPPEGEVHELTNFSCVCLISLTGSQGF